MGGDANDFHSLVIGLAVGGGSGKCGQERGVDIEDSVFPVPNKVGGENFHEAGEYDEIHLGFLEMRLEGSFGFLAVAVVDRGKRKAKAAREGAKLGMISSEENRLGVEAARFPCAKDGFGGMGFFRDKNGQPAAGS